MYLFLGLVLVWWRRLPREDWQTQNNRGTVSLFPLEEATMERLTVYHNPG
jgi:hypothetical protein